MLVNKIMCSLFVVFTLVLVLFLFTCVFVLVCGVILKKSILFCISFLTVSLLVLYLGSAA